MANRFTAATDPVLALALAGGRGYWLVGVLVQTCTYGSAMRLPAKPPGPTAPPSPQPAPPSCTTQTDTYITTYTATDPVRSTSRQGRPRRVLRLAPDGQLTPAKAAQPSIRSRHLTGKCSPPATTSSDARCLADLHPTPPAAGTPSRHWHHYYPRLPAAPRSSRQHAPPTP